MRQGLNSLRPAYESIHLHYDDDHDAGEGKIAITLAVGGRLRCRTC